MKIRITPILDEDRSGEVQREEFEKLIAFIQLTGWMTLPLHFTDGTVLMRQITPEEFAMMCGIRKIEQPDET